MRALTHLSRFVLGAVFLVMGLNKFFQFIALPAPPEGAATAFTSGLMQSGYFFYLLATVEVACALAISAGRFVPLALTVLAPVVVNITAYHLFLAPAGMPLALLLVGLLAFLAWCYRGSFRSVVRAAAEPNTFSKRSRRDDHFHGRPHTGLRDEPAEA